MKRIQMTVMALASMLANGCIGPNWQRLVPENKDADIKATIGSPWGVQQIDIHTRVNPAGTNPLSPLAQPTNEK